MSKDKKGEVLSFCISPSCAGKSILAIFFAPAELEISLRSRLHMPMFQSFDPRREYSEDAAIAGPVRATSCQIRITCARLATMTAATFATLILWTGAAAAAPQRAKPDFAAITHAIETWFAAQPDYQNGDLITRIQIETVLEKLSVAGVEVPDARAIAARGLANDSFLVRELTKKSGRPFMRRLARTPGAFAHLDRLSTIPRGELLIRDLIQDPGGDKLIEYMATTKGGHNMGTMMTAVPGGTDLNKPTNRIYTVAEFLSALEQALAEKSP